MSFSANELGGLAQKAARGAGFPPRQAELFGAAAVLHLASGGDAGALEQALADPQDSPILRLPLLTEDILRALTLTGPEVTLTLQPGDEALALSYTQLLHVCVERAEIEQAPDGLPRLTVRADLNTAARPDLPARIDAPEDLVAWLGQLAAETFVPPSEASRSAGAGAGNIDND